ncbi:MAG TPA: NUDIX domain-containing protein [Marinagarivorans sp.]
MDTNNSTYSLEPEREILPAISIDCLVFGLDNGRLNVLLAKHRDGIRQGQWALPGGHIGKLEDLNSAASRILQDVTGARDLFLEQLRAFGAADRFPDARVITIAYYALVKQEEYELAAGGPASDVKWWDIHEVPELVYDHREILNHGLKSLRHKVRHEPVGFNLLPDKFTLLQLQELYESILDVKLDKPNFRRKMMNMKLLVDCHEKQQNVAHRAAALYRFDESVYHALTEQGFSFEV